MTIKLVGTYDAKDVRVLASGLFTQMLAIVDDPNEVHTLRDLLEEVHTLAEGMLEAHYKKHVEGNPHGL